MNEEMQKILSDAMNIFFEKTGIRADLIRIHPETKKMPIFDEIADFAKNQNFSISVEDQIEIGVVIFDRIENFSNVSTWREFIPFETLFASVRPGINTIGHLKKLIEDMPEDMPFDGVLPDGSIIKFSKFTIVPADPAEYDERNAADQDLVFRLIVERMIVEADFKFAAPPAHDFVVKYTFLRNGDEPLEFENFDDAMKYIDSPRALVLQSDRVLCEGEIEIGASLQMVGVEIGTEDFRTMREIEVQKRLRDEAIENEKQIAQAGGNAQGGAFYGLF